MLLEGEYVPSPWEWVRDQVEGYESSGGQRANTFLDTGLPVVIVTTRGNKSGTLRKTPLMRVEHDGKYAVVASLGGNPKHPVWYLNLIENPDVRLQDLETVIDGRARVVTGDEKKEWWKRAVEANQDKIIVTCAHHVLRDSRVALFYF